MDRLQLGLLTAAIIRTMISWPPTKRTLTFFFVYWLAVCVAIVFTGSGEKLMSWLHSFPWLIDWLLFLLFFGVIALALWGAARLSDKKFRCGVRNHVRKP